jgi:hypothetical protein
MHHIYSKMKKALFLLLFLASFSFFCSSQVIFKQGQNVHPLKPNGKPILHNGTVVKPKTKPTAHLIKHNGAYVKNVPKPPHPHHRHRSHYSHSGNYGTDIWIPGHWSYNPQTHSQVWIEGYAMVNLEGGLYVQGHWVDGPHGPRWVPGHWINRGYPVYKGKK